MDKNEKMTEKEAYKTGREEKHSPIVFGCVVVAFICMKLLGAG